MTIDSIFISSLIDQNATVLIDAVSYNPNGSLGALVPEPTSFTNLSLGVLLFRRCWAIRRPLKRTVVMVGRVDRMESFFRRSCERQERLLTGDSSIDLFLVYITNDW